jgi:hypothetical protein
MFSFTNRVIYDKIVVIGCGGTGSRLIPLLTQFFRTISRQHGANGFVDNPKIYLVDDDVV